jgi:hypothetical protein
MLSPHEFSVGYISDAVGLTLILPRNKYETCFIVIATAESKIAVVLEGDHRFLSFDCRDNTSWKGLVIPNVTIEVDESSVTDAVPLGAMVRTGTTLGIKTKLENRMGGQIVPLVGDLSPCRDTLTAGFVRWHAVIGEGHSKRELRTIEADY